MIGFLAFVCLGLANQAALGQVSAPSVEAVPIANGGMISVDIFEKYPGGGPLDLAIEKCIEKMALTDTRDYGYQFLKDLTDRGHGRIDGEALPCGIHYWFKLNPADVAYLVPVATNLLFHPLINEETVANTISELQSQNSNLLSSVLHPWKLPYGDIQIPDVKLGLARLAQPSQIFVTIGCSPKFAYLANDLSQAISKDAPEPVQYWKKDPLPFVYYPQKLPAAVTFSGSPIDPKSPEFASQLLAMMALGSGKGSIIWDALRTQMRLSYLQEADFIGTAQGLTPILFAFAGEKSTATIKPPLDFKLTEVGPEMISTLKEKASQLNSEDLGRVKATARSVFELGFGMNPFHILSKEGTDPLFMDSYWRSLCGSDPSWPAIMLELDKVSLDQLKASILELLTSMKQSPLTLAPG